MTTDADAITELSSQSEAAVIVSLVVATYGRTTEFDAMLKSLANQREKRFEVIVVDQNPDDRLVPMLDTALKAGIPVKHVRMPPLGLTAVRNAGLTHARGELVGFPDDDCWYEPDVVERLVAYFADNAAVDGIVGRWVEHDPGRQRLGQSLRLEDMRRFRSGIVASFTLFFRTTRLRDVDGFSEYLGIGRYFGSAEEEDLMLRLVEAGARIDYLPDIDIHHPYNAVSKLSAQLCKRHRFYGRGTGAVLAKHRMPIWVIGRGLVGPIYNGLRGPDPKAGLVLGACTILGRVEGLAGWWLWGRRHANATNGSRH